MRIILLLIILTILFYENKIIENYDETTDSDNPNNSIMRCVPKSDIDVSSIRALCSRLKDKRSCKNDTECKWIHRSSHSSGGGSTHSSGSSNSSNNTSVHSGTSGGISSTNRVGQGGEDNTDLMIGISLGIFVVGIIIFLVVQYA